MGWWADEPVRVTAAVSALLMVAVSFGLDLTGEQVGAISAAVVAVGAIVTRRRVTPAGRGGGGEMAAEGV